MTQAAVRPAALAGSFYPAGADQLAGMADFYLAQAPDSALPAPKALIAPHAGFIYSGPIAARAYARLRPGRAAIRRVVLLCPNHRVALRGLAAPTATAFRTPLGDVGIDHAALAALVAGGQAAWSDQVHAQEHAIEVHLPFLQRTLDDFVLVPLVVGEAPPDQVGRVLDSLWGGPETLILISSDLSHYHGYDEARIRDERTAAAIERLDIDALLADRDSACGRHAIAGLLNQARSRELACLRLDLRNSGDTEGEAGRVVGYGAWAFAPADQAMLDAMRRRDLLQYAVAAIEGGLAGHRPGPVPRATSAPELATWRASFVTLERAGNLRGCIGSLQARGALADDVARNAWNAAFADPRFAPLQRAEMHGLEIHVSVLTPPVPFPVRDEAELLARLRPGIDGLILADGARRATFLPAVWDDLPEPAAFVAALRRKAGLPAEHWSESLCIERYTAECFGGRIDN
jgi:AmmeMemoRadiSam system protein B/AmmeMemoRadiSam system protein A